MNRERSQIQSIGWRRGKNGKRYWLNRWNEFGTLWNADDEIRLLIEIEQESNIPPEKPEMVPYVLEEEYVL